jgi:hypothetical protein
MAAMMRVEAKSLLEAAKTAREPRARIKLYERALKLAMIGEMLDGPRFE